MDVFESIRRQAAELHAVATERGANPWKPWELACQAAEHLGCAIETHRAGSRYLKGCRGFYEPTMALIAVERSGTDAEQALLAAHELGHVVVHKPTKPVHTYESDPSRVPEGSTAVERLVDYGVRERREVQMDLFAREFALPRHRARELFLVERLSAKDIVERSGLPYAVVAQQIFDAVLLPEYVPPEPKSVVLEEPNPVQDAAVEHEGSPYQLQAGPGTGKTKTLIRRIERLLERGVDPQNILVLTFSNKAAGELTDRLAARRPDASAVWIGTFHAFGYDVLKRFSEEAGLPATPQLIDKVDQVDLIEDALPRLGLRHFRNLYDPTLDIADFLRAISRAKDEVVDAAAYAQLAEATLVRARASGDEKAVEDAEKTLEVGQVYAAYERRMRAAGRLDFGDLVMRPVELLRGHPEVVERLRTKHTHILVDEYQDVNRASVLLLQQLAGSGKKLWVVGDSRQSIYRFRGASSVNMAKFADDFPGGAKGSLDRNYRSNDEVKDTFVEFAKSMKASESVLPLSLSTSRGACGERPQLRPVDHPDDEPAAVAHAIRELADAGIAFRDQAVLCRGNKLLSTMAEGLERRNIPILYLGNLFDREEIKDLLALLALVVDPRAATLPRVATIARYHLSLGEVARLLKSAANETSTLAWAATTGWADDPSSMDRCQQLASDLGGFDMGAHPWAVLSALLLDRSDIVRDLLASTAPRDRVKAVALWQFLTFTRALPRAEGPPILAMLDRVRRLVLLSEERDLRQMPAAAEAMNAVRLMTVHGSKGLEFEAVHVPGMTKQSFPSSGAPVRCVPPDGMITGTNGLCGREALAHGNEEEEECLFFVAMSRAKRHLRLYASRTQRNGNARTRSPLLLPIASNIDEVAHTPLFEPGRIDDEIYRVSLNVADDFALSQDEVQLFNKCPRRYFYTRLLRVPGRKLSTPFATMHDVVYEVISWLRDSDEGVTATIAETQAKFDAVWVERGPTAHSEAEAYRTIANDLVKCLVDSRSGSGHLPSEPIEFVANGLRIVVTPDEIRQMNDGLRVRRIRTGKKKSDELDDISYPLYLLAVERRWPGATVEVIHLTDGGVTPVAYTPATMAQRRKKVDKLGYDILSGLFPPKESERTCPKCPHYFVCGAAPAGELALT